MVPTLAYRSDSDYLRQVTLLETDDELRLIFPLAPKWVRWLAIAMVVMISGLATVVLAIVVFRIRSSAVIGTNKGIWLFALSPHVFACCCSYAVVTYLIVFELRWGHLPASISLVGRTMTDTTRGLWGMNDRWFDVAAIESFQVRSLRDIFGRNTSFKLVVRIAGERRLWRQFSTHDEEVPKRIQDSFTRRISSRRQDEAKKN